ncbi:hypothetical protein BSK62_13100 [Paenibacillus odorifer]|uniref:phage antirepressor N-terminal domain-containing protein n=1 Tax=Paenibacillus odorifer TaxID=189426 RepID=UPI00096E728C|nr:phage antirepressor N-terminal domain-containing protein [Paenibacillus odorifer]OMD65999.1 hypothetical protein BSK62_13100 [Paenibacillus odorifer]
MDKQIEVMEQKLVEFNGAELLGVKATDGKIYAGVRWICEGIGLTDDQIKNERKRIQRDVVLQQGGLNLTLLTNGGDQDVLVIEIGFLPLWLAKISITPKMKNNQPEVSQKLIEYQLKAKDVLADAFLTQNNNVIQIPTEINMIGQLLEVSNQSFKALVTMKQEINDTKKEVQEAKEENRQLKSEIDDVRSGLVDIEAPLRSQFVDAVKGYKNKNQLDWSRAYNNVYDILGKQHHINIKLRAQNQGKRPLDIIEDLNLLVPAIRLAKTMAS